MTRYIFITGGVVSSLGKGLASASLAALLQARGFKVRLRKLDPYLNVDPGTMNPSQHGEVFVTVDGAETDLDLGHYERFTGVNARKSDNITTGQIYSNLLAKERRGDYLGGTVQVIPHVTDLIKAFIVGDTEAEDFVLCEIGGTVGDIEGLPFFEAIRQLRNELWRERVCFIHVTLVPYIAAAGELKTKPTQHSVKELRTIGIQPDILLCRSEREVPISERRKIALFCNVKENCVIQALDADSIYKVPSMLHAEGLDVQVLEHFGVPCTQSMDLSKWDMVLKRQANPKGEVTVAMVGKYTDINDTYKSLTEALAHAGFANEVQVNVRMVNARDFEECDIEDKLRGVDAILVPGGFGEQGVAGKIKAVTYAREHKIPYLGICLGMQIACIEMARNLLGIRNAYSTEFAPYANADARGPLVGMMTEWLREDGAREVRGNDSDLGGTMRLGAYECELKAGSLARQIYGRDVISERHRHRYEVNTAYAPAFEAAGVIFSGFHPSGHLPEIVELPQGSREGQHPFFIGVQFHPEFGSRPYDAHPLFAAYIKAAKDFRG